MYLLRINPDEKDLNIFKEISKIHRYIKKSTKKLLIDDLSKRLLELEFKHTKLQKMRNTQSIIKLIKIGKQPGTTYCLRCKDYMQNFRPEKVKTTKKVLREKSVLFVDQISQGF